MGQMGSAFSNPNTFAPQPSGFNGSEWAARFLGAGAKGLGQGLQNMSQRPQPNGAAPIQSAPVMPVDSSYFLPPQSRGRNDLNFYGGS